MVSAPGVRTAGVAVATEPVIPVPSAVRSTESPTPVNPGPSAANRGGPPHTRHPEAERSEEPGIHFRNPRLSPHATRHRKAKMDPGFRLRRPQDDGSRESGGTTDPSRTPTLVIPEPSATSRGRTPRPSSWGRAAARCPGSPNARHPGAERSEEPGIHFRKPRFSPHATRHRKAKGRHARHPGEPPDHRECAWPGVCLAAASGSRP